MTAATYTSDLSDIYMFESTTNVTAYGGGGAGLSASPDLAMEGTNCVDKPVSGAEKGFLYDNVSNFTIGADDHFYVWIVGSTPGLNDSRNNRGIVAGIGDDTSNFVKFHVDGNDTLPLGGGKPYAIRFVNTTLTNYRTLVGSPGTTPSQIGGGLNTTASVKGANLGVDAARIGTGYDILYGTGADPEANFAGIAADDQSTSEGVLQPFGNGYALQGKLRIGSAANACEFLDSDVTITILDTIHSLTDFNEILLENASSILTLTRVTFDPLGTNSPGRFEMLTSTATANLTGCTFKSGWGDTILGTGATFLNCVWINTDIITGNGADLTGSEITGFEGTAGTSPLIWNVATDPDGYLDDMSFTKGTAATHAIEFGTTSPTSLTLRGIDFSGYNASHGQNDSTFHVKRTSGSVTINLYNCSGNFTYKTDGATVTISAPETASVHVEDKDGNNVQGAQVHLARKPKVIYTSGAGNSAGDSTLVITQTIPGDVPQTGRLEVFDFTYPGGLPATYRWASHDGANTFTLRSEVTYNCTGGGTSTSLQDTVNDFTALDIEEGDAIRNTTDGSWAVVKEIVDADNITTSPLRGGSDNTWTSGDTYSLHRLATTLVSGTDLVDIPYINAFTDASGDVSTNLPVASAQAVSLRVRWREGATKYRDFVTSGNISATTGYSANVVLDIDEVYVP